MLNIINIIMLSAFVLNVIMLSAIVLYCRNAVCHFAGGHCAVIVMLNVIRLRCRSAKYCYAECRYAECRGSASK
jgi:hypothetical protein